MGLSYASQVGRSLLEFTKLGESADVNEETGLISGVRVLGAISSNARRYKHSAMREAVGLYEGTAVYVDHPESADTPRKYGDHLGSLQNVRFQENAIYADLQVNLEHPLAKKVLWDAKNRTPGVGLSHNADGVAAAESTSSELVIGEIKRVRSVDLVASPGTNRSLFEQHRGEPVGTKSKIKALLEAHAAGVSVKLLEMLDEAQVEAVLMSEDMEDADKLLAIMDLVAAAKDEAAPEQGEEPEKAEEQDGKGEGEDMQEQLSSLKSRAEAAELRAKRQQELLESGLPDRSRTKVFVEAYTSEQSDARAKALLKDRLELVEQKSQSADRRHARIGLRGKSPRAKTR